MVGFQVHDAAGQPNGTLAEPPSLITDYVVKNRQKWLTFKGKPEVDEVLSQGKRKAACLMCGGKDKCISSVPDCLLTFRTTHLAQYNNRFHIRPSNYGLGVFVALGSGPILSGAYIGEYIGEIYPPEYYSGDYGLAVANDKEQAICTIDSNKAGNWTRYINSNCVPNIDCQTVVISEERIVVFQAKRNINAGEEITFNYGRDYFVSRELRCTCTDSGKTRPHFPPQTGAAAQILTGKPAAKTTAAPSTTSGATTSSKKTSAKPSARTKTKASAKAPAKGIAKAPKKAAPRKATVKTAAPKKAPPQRPARAATTTAPMRPSTRTTRSSTLGVLDVVRSW